MKRLCFTIIFTILCSFNSNAQSMTGERLLEILTEVSDTLQQSGNTMQFVYKERPLMCIFDDSVNRMRIISPIIERQDIDEEELLNALVANFHSALDVKYALSDEIIWSVFIHPLQELTDHQVRDAVQQVYSAAVTFGTTYSSTHLVFPGNTNKEEEEEPKKNLQKSKI